MNSLLGVSVPILLETVLSVSLEITDSERLASSCTPGASCLSLPSMGQKLVLLSYMVYVGAGDPNSGPYAYEQAL